VPRYLSTDHDPLFEAHRWAARRYDHVTVSFDPAKVGRARLTQKIETVRYNVTA